MKQIIIMDQITRILESCDGDEQANMVLTTLSFLRGYALGLSKDTLISPFLRELLKEEKEFGIKKYERNREIKWAD